MEDHDDGLYVDDGGWKCSGNGVDGGGRYTGNDLAKEVKLSEEKTDAVSSEGGSDADGGSRGFGEDAG